MPRTRAGTTFADDRPEFRTSDTGAGREQAEDKRSPQTSPGPVQDHFGGTVLDLQSGGDVGDLESQSHEAQGESVTGG